MVNVEQKNDETQGEKWFEASAVLYTLLKKELMRLQEKPSV